MKQVKFVQIACCASDTGGEDGGVDYLYGLTKDGDVYIYRDRSEDWYELSSEISEQ